MIIISTEDHYLNAVPVVGLLQSYIRGEVEIEIVVWPHCL